MTVQLQLENLHYVCACSVCNSTVVVSLFFKFRFMQNVNSMPLIFVYPVAIHWSSDADPGVVSHSFFQPHGGEIGRWETSVACGLSLDGDPNCLEMKIVHS